MNRHLHDIELIELTAGNLPAAEEAAARRHLASCANCRHKLHQHQQTWDILGHWQINPPQHENTQPFFRITPRHAAAVAAAILIGATVGWLSHDLTYTPQPNWHGWQQSTPSGLVQPMLSLAEQSENQQDPS